MVCSPGSGVYVPDSESITQLNLPEIYALASLHKSNTYKGDTTVDRALIALERALYCSSRGTSEG